MSYVLEKTSLNNNILYFYINEGRRAKIVNVDFEYVKDDINNLLFELSSDFTKKLDKNKNFFFKSLIDEYLDLSNTYLVSNNIHNIHIDIVLSNNDQDMNLSCDNKKRSDIVNKINITGN